MEIAHLIEVGQIAQRASAVGESDDISWEVGGARKSGFSNLLVRDDDGSIRRWVEVQLLPAEPSWRDIERKAQPIPEQHQVSRNEPLFRVLNRLHDLGVLVVDGGPGGVEGVVTEWDVNQRGARLFGFGLCLVVEAELADAIGHHLEANGPRPWQRLLELLAEIGAKDVVSRHEKLAAEDRHLDPLIFATFEQVRELARRSGALDELAAELDRSVEALNSQIAAVQRFRNDVGHEREDALSKEGYVLRSLILAEGIARELDDLRRGRGSQRR